MTALMAEPQAEHRWLEKLVGEWSYHCDEPPGGPVPIWTETVRSIDGCWFIAEGRGDTPEGVQGTTIMTLGYDPRTGAYVGTWIGSMMTHLWVYKGALDETGRVLTLDTEGPDFSGGPGLCHYQDIIEFLDDDHRTLTARVQGEDGAWTQIMKSHYRRIA